MIESPSKGAGAPRGIGFHMQLRMFFRHPLALFGILFFSFGIVFSTLFFSRIDTVSLFHFREDDPAVTGTAISTDTSGASSNDEPI